MIDDGAEEPRVRLFTALELPEHMRAAIRTWSEQALDDPVIRPVATGALHVTLAFLGHLPERVVPELAGIVQALQPSRIGMRMQSALVAIPPRRPRLYALALDSPGAVALQAALATRLAAAGHYEREQRPFWPHVTVARLRARPRGGSPAELPDELLQPFEAVRVSLYRSTLRPEGAEYVSLASLNLPPAATEPGAEER